ncbi:FAD-dependent oxidoreductase [Deinococcus sp. QL22]|uniref:FAD-dependent oxidoreductase n=1 Tax=Deinococcus sp. QL22 TaxID=2939437 RepID=UPI0020172145|nr:FAD-dependent oxidoreductase [Deinococcus sp. QL22]UQN05131.1 FAD-dependent oxidoreductase [Deinococcus sp. QL22]
MTAAAAGQVWAHVGQSFSETEYDIVIIGAGRMGAACALYLRQLMPGSRLLLTEQGGLPNEDGATILAAGVWTVQDIPDGDSAQLWKERANWTRAQLAAQTASIGNGIQFQSRPLLSLHPKAALQRVPTAEALAAYPGSLALLDADLLPFAEADLTAAAYRPGALAAAQASAAVRAGADLMLNTQAHLVPGGVRLDRLTVTNTHQIVTHETHTIRAGFVVVAAGAEGPELLEQGLGIHTTHARAYRQTPRLNAPSDSGGSGADLSPVLRVDGLTLRPQNGGYTLYPRIHHRDPHGYAPTGGRLTGVPVGLRRETLEDLVGLMDALPVLGTEALETGRSLADVPGAWLALPNGRTDAPPLHQRVLPDVSLLLGGPLADTFGLAVAFDLAASLAGVEGRPWEEGNHVAHSLPPSLPPQG